MKDKAAKSSTSELDKLNDLCSSLEKVFEDTYLQCVQVTDDVKRKFSSC